MILRCDKIAKLSRENTNTVNKYSVPGVDLPSGSVIVSDNIPCYIDEGTSNITGNKYGIKINSSPKIYFPRDYAGVVKSEDIVMCEGNIYKLASGKTGKIYFVCDAEKLK